MTGAAVGLFVDDDDRPVGTADLLPVGNLAKINVADLLFGKRMHPAVKYFGGHHARHGVAPDDGRMKLG